MLFIENNFTVNNRIEIKVSCKFRHRLRYFGTGAARLFITDISHIWKETAWKTDADSILSLVHLHMYLFIYKNNKELF